MPTEPKRVREMFDEIVDRPAPERAAFLAAACGDDDALRRAVERLLTDNDKVQAALPDAPAAHERAGDHIGPYRLLESIGEGGFGVVWMAEQQRPIRRKVALKILKWGMDTRQVIARFEAERQALALMDHANIARVFDGGATDTGRPYFAMELVRGVPITKYCDEAKLSPRERLALFVAVCEAVQHAHQKGVIHRDIKPGNVLVTLHDGKPVPKVIDFGIAKATQGQLTDKTVFTGFRQMLGTPEYMAPEQAEMSGLDVDTRADVYSLGALLYELLTGTKPFELKDVLSAGYEELLRHIKEVDPDKPSTRVSTLGKRVTGIATRRRMLPKGLSSAFRGDLDWIVLKAMEKERGRRYETAHALAQDLERHLRDEPVLAGPPSRAYRWRKYVRRHRLGVAAGAAIVLSLATGLVLAWFGYAAAKAQEHAATTSAADSKRQAAKAQHVVALLDEMLTSADPHEKKGRDYRVRDLLEDFDRKLAGQLTDEPEVEAVLSGTLGRSFLGLGMHERAARPLERAIALHGQTRGENSLEFAAALHDQANLLHDRSQFKEAAALAHRSLAIHRAPGRTDTKETAEVLSTLGDLLRHVGRFAEAEATCREAVEVARRTEGEDGLSVVHALAHLALVLDERDGASAEAVKRDVVDRLRRAGKGDDLELQNALLHLCRGVGDVGKREEARQLAEEALAIAQRACGEDHPAVAYAHMELAGLALESKDYQPAEGALRRALTSATAASGERTPLVASILRRLAKVRGEVGDLRAAEDLARRALAIDRDNFSEAHPDVATGRRSLADVLRMTGAFDAAEAEQRRALAIYLDVFGEESLATAACRSDLGFILSDRGDHAGAEREVHRALGLRRKILGDADPRVASTHENLGVVRYHGGDLAGAEHALDEALRIFRARHGDDHLDVARVLDNLSQVRSTQGNHQAAIETCERALSIRRSQLGPTHLEVGMNLLHLGRFRALHGDCTGADATLRQAQDILSAIPLEQRERRAACCEILASARHACGDLAGALTAREQELALDRERLGAEHARVGRDLVQIGLLQVDLGAHDAAVATFAEATTILGKAQGDHRRQLALIHNGLGASLSHREELDAAEAQYRRAEALVRSRPGGIAAVDVSVLENLGLLHQQRGDLAAAERVFREGLELRRRLLPGGHEDLAKSLTGLGDVLYAGDRFAEAEPLFREALAVLRKGFVGNHERVAQAVNNLGTTLVRLQKLAEAEPLEREFLTMLRALHGDGDDSVAKAVMNLVIILRGQRSAAKSAELVTLLREMIAGREAVKGADDSHVRLWRSNLASFLSELDRPAEAEIVLRSAIATLRGMAGDHRGALGSNLRDLAQSLAAQGQLADALPHLEEALAIQRDLHGDDSLEVASCRAQLGGLHFALDRHADAQPHLRAACERLRREPNRQRALAETAGRLGEVLLRLDRLPEAEACSREAIDLVRQFDAKRPERLATELSRLGVVLLTQERFAEAEPVLREDTEVWRTVSGDASLQFAQSLGNHAKALIGLARGGEAEAIQRQAWKIACELGGVDSEPAERLEGELISGLIARGSLDEAETLARARLARHRSRVSKPDSNVATAIALLARALSTRDAANAEAGDLLTECLRLRTDLAPDGWQRFDSMSQLGACRLAQSNLEDAEPLLRESAERLATLARTRNSRTAFREACDRMARLSDAKGQAAEATSWRTRAEQVPR